MIVLLERRQINAFKTALCKSFKQTGFCVFGNSCRFAHGEEELRLPPQVQNYFGLLV